MVVSKVFGFSTVMVVCATEPVKVLVCTEPSCPNCEQFVHLVPIYTSQLDRPEVMDLQMAPYGNTARRQISSANTVLFGECDAKNVCEIYKNSDPTDCIYPFSTV